MVLWVCKTLSVRGTVCERENCEAESVTVTLCAWRKNPRVWGGKLWAWGRLESVRHWMWEGLAPSQSVAVWGIPWSRDCEGEAVVREPASVRRAETAGRCANAGMQLLGAVETSDSCWDSECWGIGVREHGALAGALLSLSSLSSPLTISCHKCPEIFVKHSENSVLSTKSKSLSACCVMGQYK